MSRPSKLSSYTPHEELLDRLSTHPEWRVRAAVAKFPNLSRATIDRLSADVVPAVRGWVANNSTTPVSVLKRLSLDFDFVVRFRLAQNLALPIELFVTLMNDPEAPVRRILTTNSAMPFFYDVANMRSALERVDHYAWTILLSRNPVPSSLLGVLALSAGRFQDVSVSLFTQSNRANLEFLLTLIALKKIKAEAGLSRAVGLLLEPRTPHRCGQAPATLGVGIIPPHLSALA